MSTRDANTGSPTPSAEEKAQDGPVSFHSPGEELFEDPDAGASDEERKNIVWIFNPFII